jgi:hypothetical protein
MCSGWSVLATCWQAGREQITLKAVKVKLILAPGPLVNIAKNIPKLPKLFNKQLADDLEQPTQAFNKTVQTVPSKLPGHPFIWSKLKAAQNRARRWWFAAIAGKIPGVRIETQGGRYKRKSDKIDAGAEVDPKTGIVTIEIPAGAFGTWVTGPKQVPSHKQTPWPRIDKEAEEYTEEVIDVAADTWFNLGEKVAGK